ncbi:hypothetical protein HYX15_04035 [Candidatus Woesearchaeota archaeon]|nr:hypothetical protein [Candidatus Woesearchaeota archaeon]
MVQEMVNISKKKLESMEEELKMLRNSQVVEEIKESLRAFKQGKGKSFSI